MLRIPPPALREAARAASSDPKRLALRRPTS